MIRHAKSPLEILEMIDGSAHLRPCLLRGKLHVFAPISRCGRGGLCYVVLVWRAESEAVTLVRTGSHHAKAIASHFVAPGDHPDPAVVRNIAPWTRITIIKNCFMSAGCYHSLGYDSKEATTAFTHVEGVSLEEIREQRM